MTSAPPGWLSTTLGQLISGFEGGRNLTALGRPPEPGEQGVLKISAVTWGMFDPRESKTLPAGEHPKAHEVVRHGDLLISRANTTELVGAAVLVNGEHPNLMLPDKILRLLYRKDVVDARYLLHALRTERVRDYFRVEATGTSDSMRNLSQPKFRSTPVLLPPLNEQRRIVAKLDALMAKSRRAKEALDAIPPLLDKLRQSILAAAFRGDLTADWRAAHPDVEPASQLLERIRAERRRRWEEAELGKLKAKGKTPTDDRWKAKYQEPEPVDESGLPELPEGWCWAGLRELATIVDPNPSHRYPSYDGGSIPLVSTQEFRGLDGWDFSTSKLVPESFWKYQRHLCDFSPDDIVFARKGRLGLARRPPDAPAYAFSHTVFIVKCAESAISAWVLWLLRAAATVEWLLREMNSNTGVPTLGKAFVEALPVPLPPLAEQMQGISIVERAFACANQAVRQSDACAGGLKHLDLTILAKAFRGELVAQDPNDEPASVLLERIRSESGVQTKTTTRRGRAKTA